MPFCTLFLLKHENKTNIECDTNSSLCMVFAACNESIAHYVDCSSRDVCEVFGPIRNLTCHRCEDNFYVQDDKASRKCEGYFYTPQDLFHLGEGTSHNIFFVYLPPQLLWIIIATNLSTSYTFSTVLWKLCYL